MLFRAINSALFGDLTAGMEVLRGSTDWSSYFEPGHERWGAYLWTVAPASPPYLITIGDSMTD